MIVLANSLLKVVTVDHAILTRDYDVLRVRDAGVRSGVLKYFKSVFAVSTALGAAAEGSAVLLSTAPRHSRLNQLTPLRFFHLTKGRAPALTPCSNVSDRVTQSRPDPPVTVFPVHRQPP